MHTHETYCCSTQIVYTIIDFRQKNVYLEKIFFYLLIYERSNLISFKIGSRNKALRAREETHARLLSLLHPLLISRRRLLLLDMLFSRSTESLLFNLVSFSFQRRFNEHDKHSRCDSWRPVIKKRKIMNDSYTCN